MIGGACRGLTDRAGLWHPLAMRAPDRIRRLTQHVTRLLAVVAALGLAALPQGAMPHVGTAGALELVLCSVDGPVTMVVDPITGETKRKAPGGSAKPACDWATAHGPVALIAAPLPPSPPQTLDRRAAPSLAVALWRPAHDPRGLYARGPPSLV